MLQKALDRLDKGQSSIFDLTEADIRYELGFVKDGQRLYRPALAEFRRALEVSATDSYFESDSMYEVGRLNLAIWMQSRNDGDRSYLKNSIEVFDVWLSRAWTRVPTKMWGHYHMACAMRELGALLAGSERERAIATAQEHIDQFSAEARSLRGYRRQSLQFVTLMLLAKNIEVTPGDPLRCNLEEVVRPYSAE